MTYEQLLDAVYELMLGELPEAEAEAEIEALLVNANKDVADKVRDSLANLFTTGPTNDKAS